jgi:peptidoglycan/LPS O-acetylase OafA/YrhL
LQSGKNIFWSIPVEFKYYFLSPLIMLAGGYYMKWSTVNSAYKFKYSPHRVIVAACVLIIVCVAVELIFDLPNLSTIKYAPVFLVGTIISICDIVNSDELSKYKTLFTVLGTISAAIIIVTVPFYFKRLFGFSFDLHSPKYFFPYAALWGLILLSVMYNSSYIKTVLESKPLRFIGLISFSMYLFHYPILTIVKKMDLDNWLNIYVFLGLSIIVSTITYFAIERPLSRVRLR